MPSHSYPNAVRGLKESYEEPEKVDQEAVVYMSGRQGPFRCDHCEYFSAPNRCQIVEGDIDPAGCCNLFEKEDED